MFYVVVVVVYLRVHLDARPGTVLCGKLINTPLWGRYGAGRLKDLALENLEDNKTQIVFCGIMDAQQLLLPCRGRAGGGGDDRVARQSVEPHVLEPNHHFVEQDVQTHFAATGTAVRAVVDGLNGAFNRGPRAASAWPGKRCASARVQRRPDSLPRRFPIFFGVHVLGKRDSFWRRSKPVRQ